MQTDPYQKVASVSLEDIVRRVFVPQMTPDIFLLVGPCRSGTTAQAKVFRALGILSHHQPLKSVLRCLLQGQEETYTLPTEPRLLMRETIGPYTLTESSFDPVAVLLRAGVPREKLHVILMIREPLSTLTSWQEFFLSKRDPEILASNFIHAYRTMQLIRQEAQASGLHVLHYVYETLRDHDPALVNEQLFSRLGMEISYRNIDWTRLAPFASTDEHVSIPTDPAVYALPQFQGLRERESDTSTLQYAAKSITAIDRAVTSQQVASMLDAGIPEIYEELRKACEADLHISVKRSSEISDYQSRHDGKP